ncbi:allophanate hydrolase [Microbacterium karelineae]|uniref:allophanate hydrolase n=1 Tax=Microbacterium karelineae TaxID=2654283 RepID=UPI0012EB0045|nr:allophanate hydrolase [Microbacterium karelineae]
MSIPDPILAVRDAFARITASEADSIWISLRDEADVAADAEVVAQRLAAGESLPLAGTTFAVKDNIDVAGLATTAAHPAFSHIPQHTATVVERLLAAGALLVGKTNMDQFATGLVGARSPYGRPSSAHHADRVSGGSSAGSGAAVGHGLVDFSLGTDTAGSGRVPGAFNRVVGLKPTVGLVPSDGVVPACPSYDTVSVFAPDVALAARVLRVIAGPSKLDPHSRAWPQDAPQAAPDSAVVAVPRDADLGSLTPAMHDAFSTAIARTREIGSEIVEIDFSPFLEAAKLLYDGGLVAERASSYGTFLAEHPDGADPSVAAIAAKAMRITGVEVIADQQRLLQLTSVARETLEGTTALLIPTAPLHPTFAQLDADPIGVNSLVGTFTNFVNLMDMSAVAVPTGPVDAEGEFGVTFVAPAFHDQIVADLAARFRGEPIAPLVGAPGTEVAVFGAHLTGEPLNHQLAELGGRFIRDIATSDGHRMLLVPGIVDRPAIVRADDGECVPGELWRLSPAALGTFLAGIAAPLGLGEIELDDGTTAIGFIASVSDRSLRDITSTGGWRAYRAGVLASA